MSTTTTPSTDEVATRHRGFIYFCEHALRYDQGVRAWLFFGPYLAGLVLLEPLLDQKQNGGPCTWEFVRLLAYLLIFPPVWRAFLLWTGLWKKKGEVSSPANSEKTVRPLERQNRQQPKKMRFS